MVANVRRSKLLKKLIIGLAALAVLVFATTTALAAVGVKANYSFSPNKANKSAGVTVNLESSDPAAPQPPIMNRIQISFAKGGKWNGAKFPKCSLSALNSKGPKGCPSKSKIGTGTGVGYAKPVVTDPVQATLTIFNGGSSILVYVFPDLGPTFVTVCKIVGGYNLDCAIPPIKTLPSAPDASVGTVKTKTTPKSIKKGKKKLGLVLTPKKCSGSWKSSATFSFTTGEKVVTPFSQKCKK
jgi:hypothetical protein